ncbi:hypothetical protein [Novacetimonas hansenii]|nr:hypothetical protein [Novacetimonas hansenii]
MIWRIVKSPFISGLLFALLMAVVCLTYLSPDRQFFVAVGGGILFFLVRRHNERWSRCFLMILSIVVSGRYLVWRFTSTLDFDGILQTVLVLALAVGGNLHHHSRRVYIFPACMAAAATDSSPAGRHGHMAGH